MGTSITLTMHQLRKIVFETSVAYRSAQSVQGGEWARAEALARCLAELTCASARSSEASEQDAPGVPLSHPRLHAS